MKKLFTMLVGVLLAGTAFGQDKWESVIVNGDLEADMPAYKDDVSQMTAETWNPFWVQYGDNGVAGKHTAEIVDGEGVDGSRCLKVVVRSDADGQAAGNQPGGKFEAWDSQFFVYATQQIPAGSKLKFSMMLRAEAPQDMDSQTHSTPGNYIYWQLFNPNPSATTEWKEFSGEITVSSDQFGSGFQTIAFNLAKLADGNVVYFDNFKLQIVQPVEIDWSVQPEWINFMRKGIWSDDQIKGTSPSEGDWQCTNFTIQTPTQAKAPVVEVPDEPGVWAVHVPVSGYYTDKVPSLDAEGNPIKSVDDEGNDVIDVFGEVVYDSTLVYKWSDGSLVGDGKSAPARWNCQFFVSTLHKMKAGERYKFKFKVKADKATSLATQVHYGPGKYAGYNTFGAEGDFPIGTDWKEFSLGEEQKKTIPADADGCQTITFDCVPLTTGEDNNFYFIFEECSFSAADVTDADRTLGDPEELALPVNSGDDELATTIDAAPMLERFEYTGGLAEFLEGEKIGTSEGLKLSSLKTFDDPTIEPIESFSGILTFADGGFINDKGLYIDSENGIQLSFDDSSIDGTKINVNVWNNPDAGIEFGDHKSLKTKLAISQGGWYYVYNIRLLSEEDYQEWIERVPGDANADKAVDIEDVVLVINQILEEPVTLKFFNADVTEDGKIDVDDVVAIVNMILSASGEEEGGEEGAAAAPQLMKILLQNGFKF